jgi:hypothetical protein
LIGLYVTPQWIYAIEAGGSAEAVAADLEKLRKAMASLRS